MAAAMAAAVVAAGVIDRESSCGIEGNAQVFPSITRLRNLAPVSSKDRARWRVSTIDAQPHAKACAGDPAR